MGEDMTIVEAVWLATRELVGPYARFLLVLLAVWLLWEVGLRVLRRHGGNDA